MHRQDADAVIEGNNCSDRYCEQRGQTGRDLHCANTETVP